MPGKHLTDVVRHFVKEKRRQPTGAFILVMTCMAAFLPRLLTAQTTSPPSQPKFLGSQSCSASSCHGGAGEKSKQYTIWSTHDFHHARPYATLETARSERLAEVLKIGDPAQNARCTVCHAPFATIPSERLGHDATIAEGVSCESCHGPAENWIRSHTRSDYTHADRVTAGMRDLNNLYVRANTCVACHQNLDPEIRAAGHPELIFEMDGQSVTMPRHWRETNSSAQIWFVGQLVALREMSWQLSEIKDHPPESLDRCSGLIWLMQTSLLAEKMITPPPTLPEDAKRIQESSDGMARELSALDSTNLDSLTRRALGRLSANEIAFRQPDISKSLHARRAERLVLALDRLVASLPPATTNSAVNQSLNKLFADAQSLPDFDPNQFANDLNTFHSSVAGFLENK